MYISIRENLLIEKRRRLGYELKITLMAPPSQTNFKINAPLFKFIYKAQNNQILKANHSYHNCT